MDSPTSPYGLGEARDLSQPVTCVMRAGFWQAVAIYHINDDMNFAHLRNFGIDITKKRQLFGRGDIFRDVRSTFSLGHLYQW
jgi:hypothetical protein